ncbi:hypothetical protein PINS_up008976 [Pythium insidiosum]|nr:hypothetical protein PINS_up008976 [Pythium insidiosum]
MRHLLLPCRRRWNGDSVVSRLRASASTTASPSSRSPASGAERRSRCSHARWIHSPETARARGLAFETRVERVFRSLGCELTATQESMDGGIDHMGVWRLPDQQVQVVTQCKHESRPVGVQSLREFQGVMTTLAPNALALFFSASGYSIYAHRFFARMASPAVICTLDPESDRLVEFLMNDRARAQLPLLSAGSCFVDHRHELVLTYGDEILG